MPVGEQSRMNALLADPDQVNVARLLADGRIRAVRRLPARQEARHHRPPADQHLRRCPGRTGRAAGPVGYGAGSAPRGRGPAGGGRRGRPVPLPPPRQRPRTDAPATPPAPAAPAAAPAPVPPRPPPPRPQGGRRRRAAAVRGAHRTGPLRQPPCPVSGPRTGASSPSTRPPRPSRAPGGARHLTSPNCPAAAPEEHIVPQLRGGPAPRQEPEQHAGHDPGLMAAFQRGIGLAEAQQHREPTLMEPTRLDPPPASMEPAPVEPTPMEPTLMEPTHRTRPDEQPRDHPRFPSPPPLPPPRPALPQTFAPKESIHHGERRADRPCIRPRLADERPRAARAAHVQRGAPVLRRTGEVRPRPRRGQRRPHGSPGLRPVSLGRSAGVRFGDGGDVRQVVVELDSTLLFVTTAGSAPASPCWPAARPTRPCSATRWRCWSRASAPTWSPRPGSTPSNPRR